MTSTSTGGPDAPTRPGPGADCLVLEGITKNYPGVRALDDVSFSCRSGEIHAIVGENGSGKSTLVKVASGAVQPDSGGMGALRRRRVTEVPESTPHRRDTGIVREVAAALRDREVGPASGGRTGG